MRNPLQEQLLKAGLAKKSRLAEVAREQAKARNAKGAGKPPVDTMHADAERVRLEKVERDRALSGERNAQARQQEARAQVRQIVGHNRIAPKGEIEYRFTAGGAIRSVLVGAEVRRQLASGAAVIVAHDDGYAIIPRAAADKVRERDASVIALDHGDGSEAAGAGGDDASDDEHYRRFKVPDDLTW